MPVKTTEYAFIPKAVLRRTSRSKYAARRKCLRPNPGPPKSEGLVLRIYTYDKYRRTHARNPLKKRVSVKKSSAFLLTKIKTKNHDAQFAGRPEGMHPGVYRPLPCPCGAFLQPAGTFHGMLTGTRPVPGARTLKRRKMTRRTPAGRFPRQGRPPQASSARLPGVLGRSGGVPAHPAALRRASPGLPRVSAVPQASRRTSGASSGRPAPALHGGDRHARGAASSLHPPSGRPSPPSHINTSATSMRHFGRINGKGPAKRTLRTPDKTSGRRP